MKNLSLLIILSVISIAGFAQQHYNIDSSLASLKIKKDSTLQALKKQKDSSYAAQMRGDSSKTEELYKDRIGTERLKAAAIYPVINAGEYSGVIPVKDINEFPDTKMAYKLLFELTATNPDSLAKNINGGLTEIARKMNLHVAAGIPLKKISAVVIAHGDVLWSLSTNAFYKEKFKTDNPNIKVIRELEALGVKFIACGQAMAFIDMKREALFPDIKVALSAQTVLSVYRLKGYVAFKVW